MLTVSYGMAQGEVYIRISRWEVVEDLASRAPYLALLALLPAALAVGLYLMANWARVVALILYCMLLFFCMFGWFNLITLNGKIPTALFNGLLLYTAASAWVLIYLLRPSIARAFREAY